MAELLIGRPMQGTVAQRQRVAHLFPVPENYPGNLVALCGAVFWSGDLELLNVVSGAPCTLCLVRGPRTKHIRS